MQKQSLLVLMACVYATMSFAQFEQFGSQPPQRESAEVRATRVTKMLRDTLKLDSEQFNDVYNIYYKEFSAMEQQMMPQGGPPEGMPPGGGGGMPPQGMGGGMPPQGMGGGMPPQGMGGGDMSNPPTMPKELTPEQIQKQQAKRQKKMKRILTEEQYTLWLQIDSISVPSTPPEFRQRGE